MFILIFVFIHWILSLFFHSFFHHRYAAHRQFSMSKSWEKFFFICCYLTHGSSYLSAHSYGIMHRCHHEFTDTEEDPHSPRYTKNIFQTLIQTRNSYYKIYKGKNILPGKYEKDLPVWEGFERFAHSWVSRIIWIIIYLFIFIKYASVWWLYLLLPITVMMTSVQGFFLNWWAHKFGYVNFHLKNDSKNILPVDLLFLGEGYHNNHHKFPGRANYACKWFEFDIIYHILIFMNKIKIIRFSRYNLR